MECYREDDAEGLMYPDFREEKMRKEIEDGIDKLKAEVRKASKNYRDQKPSMSDKTYDDFKKLIVDFEKSERKKGEM